MNPRETVVTVSFTFIVDLMDLIPTSRRLLYVDVGSGFLAVGSPCFETALGLVWVFAMVARQGMRMQCRPGSPRSPSV